jgi:hypothetical protein
MQRLHNKYIRIAIIVVGSLVLLILFAGIIAFAKREALLQHEIAGAKLKAKRDYNLDLEIGSAHFTGLGSVSFTDITIVPLQRDSLLRIKQFDLSVKIWPLLFGNIKLADVKLLNGHLNLTDIHDVKNFEFLFKKKKDTSEIRTNTDLSELADNLINQALYKIPDNLTVNNFLVSFTNDSTNFKILTKSALIKNGQLTSTINVNNGSATWHFEGRMHPSDNDIDVKLYADGKKVELPFLQKRYRLKINFDTLSTRLSKVEHSGGVTRVYGSWQVRNLLINQPGLSAYDITVPEAGIKANVFIGANYVSVDSSSLITLKNITAHPYIKYTLQPVKIYELKLSTGWLEAQDMFDSFPKGLFDSLEGMQVGGRLNYKLNIFLDAAHPDDVQFDSRLDKDGFRIISYGKANLTKLNSEFVYTPYEKGEPMPPREIGPSNPNFTPLNDIAPQLRYAVMTAEDPSFYSNRGFVKESIRQSLATDFKTKKFKRGGSTISMQLVKNAFLSRQKTLARKIEEIMIVWLIENNNLMTKDRMLEVYFNIIEWGRNVYGIGEASRYYFDKTPAELTIGESIYLASIVPSPKAGLYAFLSDGSLRPGLAGYFNNIGNLMALKGQIEADSTGYGFSDVRLKESLRKQVAPVDTTMADSLMKQEDEDAEPTIAAPKTKTSFFQRLFGKKDSVAGTDATKAAGTKDKLKSDIEKLKDGQKKRGPATDTTVKTKKEIRQELRHLKREKKQQEAQSTESNE